MQLRAILLAGALVSGAAGVLPGQTAPADSAERARVVHLLSRVTFGARPGDVDRVLAMGIDRYLDQQLHPDRIADDATERYLRALDVLARSPEEIARAIQQAQRERRAAQARGDTARPMPRPDGGRGPRRYVGELQQAAMARAVLSERQLYEVMVDFWVNHFNVFMGKPADLPFVPAYIEQAIRPRALGKFEDLLVATAKSPAMLAYLDNALSVAPGATPPLPPALRQGRQRNARLDSLRERIQERMPKGINENYGRELLELHTLGVDGGYTQEDVVNAARVFTGWSVRRPRGYDFVFNDWAHVQGPKTVLGETYDQGGMREGLALLHDLAVHPATRRHVTAKLCLRLVSDVANEGCVEAGVKAWRETDGDIRAVVQAIVTSPAFWAPEVRGAKLKTPLEFVASAVRAVNGTPDDTPRLAQVVARLGQPLFLESAPTGYPERQDAWVNSGALLDRFNVALGLAAGRLPGATYDPDAVVAPRADTEALIRTVNDVVLNGEASAATLATLRHQLADIRDPVAARALAVGLALGSPEFQRQ